MFDKYFYEHYALLVLSDYSERYVNLQHSDRPDLVDYDKSIGVEVTTVDYENIPKVADYYNEKLKGHTKNEINSRGLSIFNQNGGDLLVKDNRILGWSYNMPDS
jgi:hypothetical protein